MSQRRLARGLFKMALENELLGEGGDPAATTGETTTTTSTDTLEVKVTEDADGSVTGLTVVVKPDAEVVVAADAPLATDTPPTDTPPVDATAGDVVVETPAADAPAETTEEVIDTADVPAVAEVQTGDAPAADVADGDVVADEDLVVIETTGDEIDGMMDQAEEVEIDSTELLQEVEEADHAVATLEGIADVLRVAAQNGGLNQDGARLLMLATEHIYNQVGLPAPLGIPALESFNISGARASATSIALEEVQGQISNIVKTIMAAIKTAVAWMQEFANKVFTANGRMQARANALIASAGKLDGAAKSTTVGNANLVKTLAIGSKIPSTLPNEIAKLNEFAASVIGDKTVSSMRGYQRALDEIATGDGDTAALGVSLAKAIETIVGTGLKTGMVLAGVAAAPEGTVLACSPAFVGNNVLWAYIPQTFEGVSSFRTGVHTADAAVADDASAPVLDKAGIEAIAKTALAYVAEAEKYKAIQKAVSDLSNYMAGKMSAVGATASVADGQTDEENAKGATLKFKAKALVVGFRASRQLIKGIHQPAFALAARVNSAALDYATASLAAYAKTVPAAVPAAPAAA